MGGTTFDYKAEVFLDSTWVDLTDYVRSGRIARGASSFDGLYTQANVGTASLVLSNGDGRWDPTYESGPHFGDLVKLAPLRILGPEVTEASAVRCGGVGLVSHTQENLGLTGDIDLRVEITPDPEQPRADPDDPVTLLDSQDAWRFEYLPQISAFRLIVVDGSEVEHTFTIAPSADNPFQTGDRRWVRVTLDISVATATLYTSTDGSAWTSRGTASGSAVSDIAGPIVDVVIGARNTGFPGIVATSHQFSGLVHKVALYDGIAGTLVADPDFTGMARTDTSVTDSFSNAWTLSRGAWVEGGDGRLPLWTGVVREWAPSFPLGGKDAVVVVSGVDARAAYAGVPFDLTDVLASATDDDSPGDRIRLVINDPAAPMRLDRGHSTVRALDASGSDSAAYMQLVADTEAGDLAVDAAGRLMFRDRHALLQDPRSAAVQAVFGDDPTDPTEHSYVDLPLVVNADHIVNVATIERADDGTDPGTAQTAVNTTSRSSYGTVGVARTDLLMPTDDEALSYAEHVVALFGDGETRFEQVVFHPGEPGHLTDEETARFELGDRVTCLLRTPYGSTIERDSFVRGVAHEWSEHDAGLWTTTLAVEDAARHAFIVLDDTDRGALSARLAY